MTITDNGRRTREDLVAAAREALREDPALSKTKLAKTLGVHFNTASPIHEELAQERVAEDLRRRQARRSKVSRMGLRKRNGSVPVGRFRSLPAPSAAVTETAPEPVDIALDEPRAEVIPSAPEPEQVTPSVPVRTMSVGAAMTAVVMACAVVAGSVYLANAGVPRDPVWQVAALVTAVLSVAALARSLTSVIGALVAGRTARDVALDLASWTVAGVAGFLAAYGQVKFAAWAGVTGNMRFLVPGILEPSVVVLLLLANRRVKRRRAGFPAKPIGKLLMLAAVLGAFAVYTNVVHAGGKAGLVFGAATVVGLILWWVKLQDDAAPDDWDDDEAPRSKRLSRKTSRYRPLRWLILFGQTRRAWLISLDHSIADAEAGLELARRWRREYDAARDLKNGRRKAKRAASAAIDKHLVNAEEVNN